MHVLSDPYEWMRPFYVAVAAQPGFAHRAIPLQFASLVNAVAVEQPAEAAKLRKIEDVPSQRTLLASFANTAYTHSPAREVELWRVSKDQQELWCVAVYLPSGIDLRLLDRSGFRRTRLLDDGPAVEALAEEWRRKLSERGWH